MYQHLVRNNEGEPMYVENVRDQYEEEEAWCEEMQHRAEDPFYAASQERQEWYNKACACFEQQGIEVPDSVVRILGEEMRKAAAKEEEERQIAEAQPVVDFLNEHLPNCGAYAHHYPESFDEVAHTSVEFKNTPYYWEVKDLLDEACAKNIYIEDYVGLSYLKTECRKLSNVSKWTARERCECDFLFVIRPAYEWEKERGIDGDYLRRIEAIYRNEQGNHKIAKSQYPKDKGYIIWCGEIETHPKGGDTVVFYWS